MMGRRQFLLHLVAWPVIAVLVIAASDSRVAAIAAADPGPAGEVRSVPVYVQSRPVYNKPSPPKPKLILAKPPQTSASTSNAKIITSTSNSNSQNQAPKVDPNLVTQTVYGFLDFVTTIGNTVMVFTPQTKKAELVKPSVVTATSTKEALQVAPTQLVEVATERSTSVSSSSSRQPKFIQVEETLPLIESSEYEPHIFATSTSPSTTTSLELNYVNLMSEALLQQGDLTGEGSSLSSAYEIYNPEPLPSVVTPEVQVRTQVNVVTEVKSSAEPPPTASKGFTLKFSKSSPSIAPVSSKVSQPKPQPPKQQQIHSSEEEPTGIIDQIFDTRVNDGTTTVHETKIIGTYIGSQYARILESSSSVLATVTPTRAPTPIPTQSPKQKLSKPQTLHIVEKPAPVTPEPHYSEQEHSPEAHLHTEKSVVSSSDDFDDDDRFNESHNDEDIYADPSSSVIIEPTPTASEEQTLYVLPQKEPKAELYVSPVPNNNAYSRQPQFFVDLAPAKSVDYIVTATPSRKQFRQPGGKTSSRFSQRFTNRGQQQQSSSTESNELAASSAQSVEAASSPEENSSRRSSPNRFRPRNRSGARQIAEAEAVSTVSVYSKTISATPSRRFTTSSRSRSAGKFSNNDKTYQEPTTFKTTQAARGFGSANTRQVQIQPSSSTSIYRFKLNRPTGRWRFKPSPKPKVNIIKTKDDDELTTQASSNSQATQPLNVQQPGPVYLQSFAENGEIQTLEESRTESNELVQDIEPELVPQTIRVATITPSEFSDLDKFLEIATIRSPYVFQAGNVKNTRYITLTKTLTKEHIQPTQASVAEATLENILATRPPYEKILEGSSDVATLPVIVLGADQATPPLETVTQSFSTTQLMLKTSILPVLYDGVTTLFTLTQSYFITRLVTAHKTVPPLELFQFVPTKALNEFNTALQEAGSENREHLLASESEADENDANYEHILAPPDELTLVGSDFDPSSMDDKFPRAGAAGSAGKGKSLNVKAKAADPTEVAPQVPKELAGLTPEQLAFLRYFNQAPAQGNNFFPPPLGLPSQPQYELTSSPVIVDTVTTIVESKTLRILFGAKPTQTTLFSTRVVPTKVTTYLTASVPVKPTAAIPNYFQPAPFPLAYGNAFVG